MPREKSGIPVLVRAGLLVRACRWPFTVIALFPFLLGALSPGGPWLPAPFLLGLIAVLAGAVTSHLVNDYADSKSGVDWRDPRDFQFFGGSKLIQQGRLTERDYLRAGIATSLVALAAIVGLALLRHAPFILLIVTGVLLIAWQYTAKPLQLAYRYAGEAVVFFCYGPVSTLAGSYTQTGIPFSGDGLLLSLPMGLMGAGVLFANEVPDYPDDIAGGKRTLVHLTGPARAWLLYTALVLATGGLVVGLVAHGLLRPIGLAALAAGLPAGLAARVLARSWADKTALLTSSKLTIAAHVLLSLGLLLGAWR